MSFLLLPHRLVLTSINLFFVFVFCFLKALNEDLCLCDPPCGFDVNLGLPATAAD